MGEIKDPIKETYDRLYDYLWNYKDGTHNQFSVSFHKTIYDGVDPENSLLINSIPSDLRGSDLTGEKIDIAINCANYVGFRRAIAIIVKYMVKYNAFIIVNEGPGITSRYVLY